MESVHWRVFGGESSTTSGIIQILEPARYPPDGRWRSTRTFAPRTTFLATRFSDRVVDESRAGVQDNLDPGPCVLRSAEPASWPCRRRSLADCEAALPGALPQLLGEGSSRSARTIRSKQSYSWNFINRRRRPSPLACEVTLETVLGFTIALAAPSRRRWGSYAPPSRRRCR